MRRPVPLRLKIALAGLAGLGLAWIIPKGGGAPGPMPTPTPTDRPGLTALEVPLQRIPQGVSVQSVDRVVVYLVRTGEDVVGMQIRNTAPEGGRVWWCPRNARFEAENGDAVYDLQGRPMYGSAPGNLVRVQVLTAAGRVTIFPGATGPRPSSPPPTIPTPAQPPARCGPSERV